ncbi:hypothetical protein VNO77_02265 [Canavalia gladiata]|uniref:Uncharacterized protein n=1 Tax=Canavalia gladiata TaxID=3824 RepID=A0AAN9MTB4_CANGL
MEREVSTSSSQPAMHLSPTIAESLLLPLVSDALVTSRVSRLATGCSVTSGSGHELHDIKHEPSNFSSDFINWAMQATLAIGPCFGHKLDQLLDACRLIRLHTMQLGPPN